MNSQELFERMKAAAIEMAGMDDFGALHIFVSDGNCEDEHVGFCLEQPQITPAERDFAERMLSDFTEEQRFAVWAFSQCADIQAAALAPQT